MTVHWEITFTVNPDFLINGFTRHHGDPFRHLANMSRLIGGVRILWVRIDPSPDQLIHGRIGCEDAR